MNFSWDGTKRLLEEFPRIARELLNSPLLFLIVKLVFFFNAIFVIIYLLQNGTGGVNLVQNWYGVVIEPFDPTHLPDPSRFDFVVCFASIFLAFCILGLSFFLLYKTTLAVKILGLLLDYNLTNIYLTLALVFFKNWHFPTSFEISQGGIIVSIIGPKKSSSIPPVETPGVEVPSTPGVEVPSPLDQFEIVPLIPFHMGNFYFSFTNPSLFMLLTLTFFLLLLYFVTKRGGGNLVPNAWQSLVELLYDFVLNLVKEQIGGGNGKQLFFPCILVTFLFLLFCNLQGMIPYSFTVTSHFLITLSLSFSLFIGITIVGFQRHGLHFFSFLLPAGVPLPLAPFLVLLELISYCFRALSLGIRLFANMMAGHSLVKILSGFAWTMLCMNEIFYFLGALGPLFIVLALTGLELGVAILQAYVFTILICIYLNDAINLH